MGTSRQRDARTSIAFLRRFARTTPGIVSVCAIAVVGFCVLAGVVTGGELDQRIAQRNAVLVRSEPLTYSAQNLYAALSAADAAAATSFLSGGIETAEMRARYRQALAGASSALGDAVTGATDSETRTAVAQMTAQLAAYTGLVEAARANNRQGFPVGSAYLREASSLMQTSLLPEAEKFYTASLASVERGQRSIGSTPVAGLALLLVALVAVVVASAVMRARTNRVFNLGLLAAAGLLVVAIAWVLVATTLAANDIEHSRSQGISQFRQLAKARILAQQARTDETLLLIARGDITAGEKAFNGRIADLGATLGTASPVTTDGVAQWNASHRRQIEAYASGDYRSAVDQAIGSTPDGSAAKFAAVESSLRDDIERVRETMRDGISAAGDRLAWAPVGTLVLSVLAAAAAVVGLWPRLKEFL